MYTSLKQTPKFFKNLLNSNSYSFSQLKKTTQLKNLLHSGELNFIMEAHNGLSAAIVQEAGFKGIWGSGLSISAQMGVRDSNEASWTQVLECIEFMSDKTDIPILLDGDTGYGNFNNARRLVKKLEARGIGGVCFEDKVFPKRNSLLEDGTGKQELAPVDEFSKKITACKDYQKDPDFQVVARVEALIANWGIDEALMRSHAYVDAGADAILIHSKKKDGKEIEEFIRQWKNRAPVVLVPTNYYSVPTEVWRDLGVSLIIWANHNMRASVQAIQQTTSQIYKDQSLVNIEGNVATVKEIFRIQGEGELASAEKKYL